MPEDMISSQLDFKIAKCNQKASHMPENVR